MNQTNSGRSHLTTGRWRIQVAAILAILALLLGVVGGASAAPESLPDAQAAGAQLKLVGPAVNPRVGETFDVQVHVQDVVGLAGYQVTLNYDNSLVHAVSVSGIDSFLNAPAIPVGLSLLPGSAAFGALSFGAGKDGSGVLATITFQAVAAGTSPLTFAPPNATNLGGIPFTSTNGSVTVDSATTNVRVVPAVKNVMVGDTFAVDVVADYVLNSGSFQFKLAFDPAKLAYTGLVGGSYLGAVTELGPTAAAGSVSYGQISAAASGPTGGPKTLATITFQALVPGASALDLSGVILTTATAVPQPSVAVDGQVNISPLPDAKFSVVPAAQTVTIGDDVYVKIHIDGAADLGAFEFKLAYNPASLSFIGTSDPMAGFLHSTGRNVFPTSSLAPGFVSYGEYSSGAAPGPNGAGDLVTLHFQAIASGSSHLTLSNQIATTTQGIVQPSSAQSGQVTINALPRASVYLQPAAQSHQIGDTFVVDVMVDGAVDLGAFQFDLAFDKNILKYVSLAKGTLISDTGRDVTEVGPNVVAGVISYGQISTDGATPGASGGPYKLASITFQGIKVGTSPLDLGKVILTTTKSFEQDKSVTDGEATITALPKAAVYVQPAAQSHEIGDTFAVDVMVNGAVDLGAFQFDLTFDKNLLQFVDLTGGTLIDDTGRDMTEVGPTVGAGIISYGQFSADGATPGANGGPYKLATIRFRGVAVGTSPLDLSKVILTTTKGFEQSKTVTNGAATIVPLPTATVRLVTTSACVRNQFDVEVWIDTASNLGAYQFKLAFNPAVMQALGADDGGFLTSTGRTLIPTAPDMSVPGVIAVGAASNGLMDGPSGTGKLAVVHFRGTALTGVSNLTLSNVILTDIDSFVQPNTAVNGSITVKPFVIKLVPASTEVFINEPKFKVNVETECAYNLGSVQFDLDYNQAIAKIDEPLATGVQVGPFLGSTGRSVSVVPGSAIDNTIGYLKYGMFTTPPPTNGPNGDGVLAIINFTAQSVGCASPLDLMNVRASDTQGGEQIPVVFDGALCVKKASSVSDTVYWDINKSKVQDAGEPGLAGVTVKLTGTDYHGNPVSKSAVTDANGKYVIDMLSEGDYTAEAVLTPAQVADGYIASTPNPTAVFHLPPSTDKLDADFGFWLPRKVCGTVWEDTNVNGIFDAGEPGILGVTVSLAGGPSVVTVADGTYCITGLIPGKYTVVQTDKVGYNSSTPNSVDVTVDKAVDSTGVNFGDWQPGSIGDRVWLDSDKDGIQDPGEPGLCCVQLHLTGTTLSGKSVDKTSTCSTDGKYLFYELEPGAYKVDVVDSTLPPGYILTTPPDPKDVALAYHTSELGVDFGYFWPGSIGDFVWWDKNKNKLQDAGEPGIAGVKVDLTGTDVVGNPVSLSKTTDANGKYLFDMLAAGTYVVNVDETTLAAGYALSTGNEPLTVVLASGENRLDADFGYWQPASICGTVWDDLNKDGVKDAGEPGLAGSKINLFGPVMLNTTSAADGGYCFTMLVAGAYVVNQENIPGYLSSTPDSVQVALGAGANSVVNFGDYYPYGSIGDLVWYDSNANGVYNAGEPGIGSVVIKLTGTDEYGSAVDRSATTAADGKYSFADLKAGTYVVNVDETTLPPNYNLTTGNEPLNVTLARAQNLTDADFGYTAPALGGWVFIDLNGNGIRDAGETAGISGITIQLRNAATNALLQTVVSVGASGWFDFAGIVPGSYKVVQTVQPAGYISTSPDTVMVSFVDGEHKVANFGEMMPPQPTATPTATATPCAICQPTSTTAPTYTPYPTYTPLPTATPTNTPEPTATATPLPTATPTAEPTATPTATATAVVYRLYLPIIQR